MIQTKSFTGHRPHCGATSEPLAYHSRYTLKSDQMVTVIRCKQHNGTFYDRYGTRPSTTSRRRRRKSTSPSSKASKACAQRQWSASKMFIRPSRERWIERGCLQAKAADREVITGVVAENIELDELYSFAGAKRPDEHEDDRSRVGQPRTHCAMARESRLLLEVVVGPLTQELATELVEGAARGLPLIAGLWSSDGWEPYLFALTLVFAVLIHFIKGRGPRPPKEPQVVPDPRVRYGQVIKQRVIGRLVAVSRQVIFGVEELIPLKQISTSLSERLNGAPRQHVAPLYRKARSFAKRRTAFDTQAQLFESYYNLCPKHVSLGGKTSAQAAGLTERPRTIIELLIFNTATASKISQGVPFSRREYRFLRQPK